MPPHTEIAITWVGADGSEWDLLDRGSPVRLSGGIAGLHLPEFTQQWTTTARVPGRRRRGVVYDGKQVKLRVHVGDPLPGPYRKGPDWRDLDARWWASLSEDDPGTLIVETARGQRSLRLWLDGDSPDPVHATDPAIRGSALYDVVLGAEDAHWSGTELAFSFEWAEESAEDFFGGAGGGGYGPPFVIAGASQFATATVHNPGEFDAWPRYYLKAPFGSATVGIGDDLITLPFGDDVAQEVHIDTDPRRLTIVNEAGENLWPLLGAAPDPLFAPVPKRQSVEVSIEMDAAGAGAQVTVFLIPAYRRALS